jgi:hypothetical protein
VPAEALRLHVTFASGLPALVTLAVNKWLEPSDTSAADGEMVTTISLVMVTVAVALTPGLAAEAAVTVIVASLGRTPGAVYRPVAETVPTAAFPPLIPFTLHATAAFVDPTTVA